MVHQTPCRDEFCIECYWRMAGELKHMPNLDEFCDYLDVQELWPLILIEDAHIFIHRTIDPSLLGPWRSYMVFLDLSIPQQPETTRSDDAHNMANPPSHGSAGSYDPGEPTTRLA